MSDTDETIERAEGTPVAREGTPAGAPLDPGQLRNEDFISYKVSVLSRIMDRSGERRFLTGFGLPLTALRILGHLHSHGEGRVLGIARAMHMLGSQVSKSMVELVEHGLVAKSPDQNDRRSAIFALTPEGRAMVEGVLSRAMVKQREVAGVVGAERYRILGECLDLLIAHYGGTDDVARDPGEGG
ncbi:MAG TPA: MarR family winged helix-turn-helix transcriptional regulator [Hyphomicrobiales bacterium]|nr:MarR family winged helix-turn-helix transcriptional regulator [Hyphomicrobiales bacterium]